MSIQVTMDALPRILISRVEEKRLTAIATAASQRVPEASAALLSELERADVLPETAMPADVVRIGSIIEFEVDDGRRLKVQLVLPENADINAGRISVLTPVGAALIGPLAKPGHGVVRQRRQGTRPNGACSLPPAIRLTPGALSALATKRDGSGNLFS
jgi:regulator of nucleoside diphosphate kinase